MAERDERPDTAEAPEPVVEVHAQPATATGAQPAEDED
jgi:hypothetical protein